MITPAVSSLKTGVYVVILVVYHQADTIFERLTFHAPGSVLSLGKDVLAFFKLRQDFIPSTIPVEAIGLVVADCNLPVRDDAAYCGGSPVAPVTKPTFGTML